MWIYKPIQTISFYNNGLMQRQIQTAKPTDTLATVHVTKNHHHTSPTPNQVLSQQTNTQVTLKSPSPPRFKVESGSEGARISEGYQSEV